MKNGFRKPVALILVFLLIILASAGCGGKPEAGGGEAQAAGRTDAKAQVPSDGAEELTLPIVKEPITLTYFSGLSGKVAVSMKNYGEMACYKELEKRTGIKIKFLHPPVGQENEQFNLLLASRDLPDIMFWTWTSITGGPARAIEDGSILKLNEAFAKYAPNISKVLKENPDAKKEVMLDDGSLYMSPFLVLDPYLRAGGPILRKDWLDKLGLSTPKTLDDWYQMLKAFKEKDPNGNGKADEIPLIAQKGNVLESLQSFTAPFGMIVGFYQNDGKVKFGPMENSYRDYLSAMQKWYKEGLLDPEYASTDSKSFDAKVTGDRAGAYIGRINNTFGRYLTLMNGKDPKFDLTGAPWPIGPGGKPFNIRSNMVAASTGEGAAISTKNKNRVEAIKWLDYQYSQEGSLLMNFGIEGESYKMEEGYPRYTDVVMKNPNGLAMTDALARYAVSPFSGPIVQERRYFDQTLSFPQQKTTIDIWSKGSDVSLLLPPITPTTQESTQMASIMGDINTYVSEMFNKFIMGVEPLDKYDEYVQTIKKMGIDEAIKIQQAALDRYRQRK